MSVTLTDTQQVSYSCEAEDSQGSAGHRHPHLVLRTTPARCVTVTPSADGTSCVFAAVAPGSATISVTDGTLSAQDVITVTPGAVASLVLTPGAISDEPAPSA